MATTFVEYTGDGNATKQFTFPSYQESDVKVRVDGVLKTTSTHYNITGYTTTGGGNVVFTSGNIPNSPANIRIYRDTNVDTAKATFTAGSSVKAADLNNNTTQLLYRAQEEQLPNLIHSYDIDDSAIETSKIKDESITTAKIPDNAVTTAKIAGDAVTQAKIQAGAVGATKLASNAVTTVKIADSNITTAKIADSNITTAKIAGDAVTQAKIQAGAVGATKLASNSVTTAKIADSNVTTAKIADSNVTTAKIANDAITTAKIDDGAVTTDKLHTASVTGAKIADGTINTVELATGAVTNAKISTNAVTTDKIADANITTAKIADDAVTVAKLAGDAVGAGQIQTGAVTLTKIGLGAVNDDRLANNSVTTAKIAANAVTTDKIADSELSTLAGMQSTTASNLASATALTVSNAELNQLDGITLETSVTTNSDTRIPTSKAVNDQILAVTNAIGGFVAIADETSFPTSNPDPSNGAGTVVSISQVSSGSAISINSSGVATISNGAGTGNTVTITGFPTTLRNTSLAASSGLQVQTTTTLHTYTFHKQLASAADIAAISATVNSFSNRYRVSSSAPTSSLDGGDLWYDTTNSKLMVYSSQNSAWEEATAIGNFFISTISSSSNTGGGSATPNGTAYRFTISDAPTSAQQLLVSVDGVIQKPNSGSSQPSEGFVLVGNDIILGAAPANGASLFVTVIGSTVGIGTPSNNTVTTAILQNGSVTTAKITDANVTTAKIADASITTAKIADDSVTNAKLPSDAVHAAQIATGAVTLTKIGLGAVNDDRLANNAVTTAKIADANVTTAKIADDAITAAKIANDALTGANMASGTITTIKLADNAVSAAKLADTTVTAGSYGSSTSIPSITIDAQGRITAASGNTVNTDLVGDTSPQLGGTLDTNNQIISFGDSSGSTVNRLKFGASNDLVVYHDGTRNIIDSQSTQLRIETDALRLRSDAGETYLQANANDGVQLYHDNVLHLETHANGAQVKNTGADTTFYISAEENRSCDIRFLADEGDDYADVSRIHKNKDTGKLHIQNYAQGSWEDNAVFANNGTQELYYDGSKKFETVTNGASITGRLGIGTTSPTDNLHVVGTSLFAGNTYVTGNLYCLADNKKIFAGANSDARMFHDGQDTYFDTVTGTLYLYNHVSNRGITFGTGSQNRCQISDTGHFIPASNNTYDIGTSSYRWRNIYTNDLNLSNEGSSNDVDGSWGDWTIQEGESDLFLKNNRSGKKYKFNLTEVA